MIVRTTFDTIKGIVRLDVPVNVHQQTRLVQEAVKDQDIQFQKGTSFGDLIVLIDMIGLD